MILPILTNQVRDASRKGMERIGKASLGIAAAAGLAGCVSVAAPDRPIEINLNITIRQEVVVRLQRDAQELIQNNPGVF
jgi:YnbE-like lipoprotein